VTISDFPIERGHILQFARAIGDLNPVYRDADYAARSEVGGIIAPPTFVEAGQHFDPDFAYHPEPGRPWFGSGREPSGGPPPDQPGGTSFHAETHFTYHGVLRPGDVLHTETRPGAIWTRQGRRGGQLRFAERVTDYLDQEGRLVVSMRVVGVHTERVIDPGGRV
jgi:hypothetical protein